MIKNKGKVLWRSILFTLVLGILIFTSAKVLENIETPSWTEMENIHRFPNAYDVCTLGPSTAEVNISNQELYGTYGIAGISLGGVLQPMYISRYVLEEILNYQSPEVIFYDVSPMFYSEDTIADWTHSSKNYVLDDFLGGIKTPDIRWNALKEAYRYNKDIKPWDYLRFPYTNKNWKKIVRGDWEKSNIQGNITGDNPQFGYMDISAGTNISRYDRKINANAEKYLCEMQKICNDHNVELILLCEKVFSEAEHDAVAELAEKYGIKFIDINENIEEIGFSYREDLKDCAHFNISGAVKWSDFLGAYLSANYEITDKRTDLAYQRYEEQKDWFEKQKMSFSMSFSAPVFYEYLAALANLDKSENIVFISVYDDASSALTSKDCEGLKALGLETDMTGQYRGSYTAVIYDSEVREAFALADSVELTGTIGNLYYRVVSGGLTSGGNACIELNGVDYMQKGRGFNFVVYNLETEEVRDSVYFDTYADPNPHQVTIKEELQNRKAEFPEGTFRRYLAELAKLDTNKHGIFVSVYDEAVTKLEDMDIALLKSLGLETDLREQYRCSYAAVICDSDVKERFSLDHTVTIEGNIENLSYKVTSGGLTSGGNASIQLNGVEYIQNGRGFNFVVYDLKTGEVEESVYFDTYANVNPYMESRSMTE